MNPQDAVCKRLLARLFSHSADERYFAVLALGSIGRKQWLPSLLRLRADPNKWVQKALVWTVGAIGEGTPEVVEYLKEALHSIHGCVQFEAVQTVGTLRIHQLEAELISILNDSSLRVVDRATWALGQLKRPTSSSSLLATLKRFSQKWDFEVRGVESSASRVMKLLRSH